MRSVTALALLVPLALLPGCSSDPALKRPTAVASASGNPVPQHDLVSEDTKKVAVTVKGGTVTGPTAAVVVPLGGQVNLNVTSDVADEVDVPGVGIKIPLEPGKPTAVSFIATTSGPLEAKLGKSGKVLATFDVH